MGSAFAGPTGFGGMRGLLRLQQTHSAATTRPSGQKQAWRAARQGRRRMGSDLGAHPQEGLAEDRPYWLLMAPEGELG